MVRLDVDFGQMKIADSQISIPCGAIRCLQLGSSTCSHPKFQFLVVRLDDIFFFHVETFYFIFQFLVVRLDEATPEETEGTFNDFNSLWCD